MHAALGLDSPPLRLPRPRSWPHVEEGRGGHDDQARRGKSARASVPRSSHGSWEPGTARSDPVNILMAQAATRVPELVPVRHGRMLASPAAFYRGSAAVMAADLARTPTTGITVQLAGDAHLANFGAYAADRRLVFDLRDFDETLPGPWEWDVKRLMASLAVTGRDQGFDDRERAAVVRAAAATYREAMREFADLGILEVWHSRMTAGDVLRRWAASSGKKTRRAFERQIEKALALDGARRMSALTRSIEGRCRIIADPPGVVPVSELFADGDALAFERIMEKTLSGYRASLSAGRRHLLEEFRYVDAARWVAGTGSVGTQSWMVMLTGIVDDEPLVLQLREAHQSVLASYAGRSRFDNQGQRVVVGQQLMQASSDILLGWTRVAALDGVVRDYFVRQRGDWRLSADGGRRSPGTMAIYGQLCAWILARAHARSGARVAIASYLGGREVFDQAMTEFAEAYADQNERDYARFVSAAREQRFDVTLEA